jgi:hypothetical protein
MANEQLEMRDHEKHEKSSNGRFGIVMLEIWAYGTMEGELPFSWYLSGSLENIQGWVMDLDSIFD